MKKRHTISNHLQRSKKLLANRDYTGSLQENQKVLSLFNDNFHKDKAIFNIGLIYAHYGNPEKDYKESRRYFERLIEQYPQSPLVEQAKIWTSIFKDICDSKKRIDKPGKIKKTDKFSISNEHLNRSWEFLALGNYKEALLENQKILSLFNEAPHKDEALFNIGLIYAHYDNPEKDYKESRMYFNKLIKDCPQSPLVEQSKIWLGIFNVIESEKQVDIEIEKKKKELIR